MIGLASYGFLLVLLVFGTLRVPAVALAAMLCLFGLKQWGESSTALLAGNATVTNFAVGLLVLGAVALRAYRAPCVLCRMTPVATLVLCLYGYALCSLAWVPNLSVALEQWRNQSPYLITLLVLAPLLLTELKDCRVAFAWTVFVGAILCALALTFGVWGPRGLIRYGSLTEQETNPLALASMAGTVFIFSALSLQRWQLNLKRALFAIAIPLSLAVMLKSGSRGQLLASGLAVLVAWPLAYPQKDIGAFFVRTLGLAMVFAIGYWAAEFVQVDSARWTGDQTTADVEGRLSIALALLAQAAASPVTLFFGLGNSSAFHYIGGYPHISALEILAEEGLVGSGIYLSILWLCGRSFIKLVRDTSGSEQAHHDRATAGILGAALLFEMILTMKQGSLLSNGYLFSYAILLSRLQALQSPAQAKFSPAASSLEVRQFTNLLR